MDSVPNATTIVQHWTNTVGDPQLNGFNGKRYKWFIDGDVSMAEPAGNEGDHFSLLLVQGPTGGKAIDWGQWVDWLGGKPTLGVNPGDKLEIRFAVIGNVLTEIGRK